MLLCLDHVAGAHSFADSAASDLLADLQDYEVQLCLELDLIVTW